MFLPSIGPGMIGVQHSRTAAAHHTPRPTSISPSTKAKKIGLASTKQVQQPALQSETDSQESDSVTAWPEISRDEPDEEEEEEEENPESTKTHESNNVNHDFNAHANRLNTLSNYNHTQALALSANTDIVDHKSSASQSSHLSYSLDHLGHHNGHIDGMTNSSDIVDYSTSVPGVEGIFKIGDPLDSVDASLYLNLDADVVGPSEGEQLEETYLNLTEDHVGSSKEDPVPVSSGEQEREQQEQPPSRSQQQSTSPETKPLSRNLTPLSELSPSPSNFNTDGDRTNGGDDVEQGDISSSSIHLDGSSSGDAAANEASGAGGTADGSISSTHSPTSSSPSRDRVNDVGAMTESSSSTKSLKTKISQSTDVNLNGKTTRRQHSPTQANNPPSNLTPGASSRQASPPKLGQSQPQQNDRPQNPYPMMYASVNANAYASSSGRSFQIPTLPPKLEGEAGQKIMTVLELNSELFKYVFFRVFIPLSPFTPLFVTLCCCVRSFIHSVNPVPSSAAHLVQSPCRTEA